jgi:uncharacterized membrane protein YgcG
MAGNQDWVIALQALQAAARTLGLPPPPPLPGMVLPQAVPQPAGIPPAPAPAPVPAPVAAMAPPLAPADDVADHNLAAIVHLLRTAPPRLPDDAIGGRFAVDNLGQILVVRGPREGEAFLKEKAAEEDARWLEVTGFQGSLGNSAIGRKVKSLFDTLLRSVRFLERFRRTRLLDAEDVSEVSGIRDSLWVRLRCSMMQVKYGEGGAQAYEENFLSGEDKLESAAAAKGRKFEESGSGSGKKRGKRGSGQGGQGGSGYGGSGYGGSGYGGGGAKKCPHCGGSSHAAKDCPKNKTSK